MNIFALVERVILKLGVIPGLGFLHNYVTDFRSRKTSIGQRIGQYQGYVRSARDAGNEIGKSAGRSKKDKESEDEESEDEDYEDDDDESYLQ